MEIKRFADNPIIFPGLHPSIGENINGPSLIRVPQWIDGALGRYYLYFAHHGGTFICLAYADSLAGPWQIHAPGCLHLKDTAGCQHVASPDVHIDHDTHRLRMYFHSPTPSGQMTFLATSDDGLSFRADRTVLGPFYCRVFRYDGWFYGLAKNCNRGGILVRSRDGRGPFEVGPEIFPRMRHAAVRCRDAVLDVYFSRAGDCPERILRAVVELTPDWHAWQPTSPATVLAPAYAYEGVTCPQEPSHWGPAHGPVRQLRDPCLYEEDDRICLLYSVAGESGIAIAEITP